MAFLCHWKKNPHFFPVDKTTHQETLLTRKGLCPGQVPWATLTPCFGYHRCAACNVAPELNTSGLDVQQAQEQLYEGVGEAAGSYSGLHNSAFLEGQQLRAETSHHVVPLQQEAK